MRHTVLHGRLPLFRIRIDGRARATQLRGFRCYGDGRWQHLESQDALQRVQLPPTSNSYLDSINWRRKNADGTAAEIEKYTVYYAAVAGTSTTFTAASVKTMDVTDATKTSVTIASLTASKRYIFAVVATNKASQESPKSDAVAATTP